MKTPVFLVALLAFSLGGLCGFTSAAAQKAKSPDTPDAVVRELYKVHNNGSGPLLERRGRKYLVRFFDKQLADLLWKEIAHPPAEGVGNLDFDPFLNTQDPMITNLRVGSPAIKQDKATVVVTFKNGGARMRITFLMRNTKEGWKIENLDYGDGEDLIKILSAPL